MPTWKNCTTVTAYWDTSQKDAKGRRHNCWRVEQYTNGRRIRLGRITCATKEEAIAAFT
jgi:hypothetical protein